MLVLAGVMVAAGATIVGAHLVKRLGDAGHVVSLFGGLTMLAGLVLGFGAMAMMLFENVYLAFTDDALVLHDNGKETTIPWGDLVAVDVEAKDGVLRLSLRKGQPIRWFVGGAAEKIAGKLEEARRKGAHGLLRTGSASSAPPS